VGDARECEGVRDIDRPPGHLRSAALELLEVLARGGHTLPPLRGRGHDPGGDGLSPAGDDPEAIRSPGFLNAASGTGNEPAAGTWRCVSKNRKSAEMHLGHTVLMRKLGHFQRLSQQVMFLTGDFTSLISNAQCL